MPLTPADGTFIDGLSSVLPENTLKSADARYLEEPRGRWRGSAEWVALPRTREDVAAIVRYCGQAGVGLVPYAGGTGLVGGQVAEGGARPLILSLERMSAIRAVYETENVMIAEAGAILADVQAAAQKADRLFALSLASEGTARIGGLMATNAGGVNVLRYGNARDLCLGLEAVLPDGQIWHGLKRLRKNNTGYDLRNLLIGAEGTLGVITAAALKLHPIPAASGTAFFVVPSAQSAIDLLALARSHLGETISAFELIHRTGLEFLQATLPDLRLPFDDLPEWSVLTDIGVAKGISPAEALETLFEAACEAGLAQDGLVAQSKAQRAEFWAVRENIPEANRRIGSVSSHDISVPISAIPSFIEDGRAAIAKLGDFRINCFGHLGDGNLHYNVFPPHGRSRDDFRNLRDAVKQTLHDLVHDYDGSVSAEHGIGRLKVTDLERYSDPTHLKAMHAIKAALDPNGIMNPGAVLNSG
ncbi:MAG: FAD-binding oxidoreductase [Rhodobacteraceae bacterium]|nr:FAD-binding oxidoreductase [Paracoccaceae bacterium]